MGVLRPDLVMRCVIPVIMAGIIAVCVPLSVVLWTRITSHTDLRSGRFGAHFELTYVGRLLYVPPGLTCAVLVSASMSLASSFIDLGAGLSVGLAGLAAGFAIGIVGDAGVRGTAQQPRLFVGMVRFLCTPLFALC